MHAAAIIPYRPQANHDTLRWVLEGFARQQLPKNDTLEVRVGLDGPSAIAPIPPGAPWPMHVHAYPQMGAAAVRNALARETAADLLIFANADTRPEPDMIEQHIVTMSSLPARSLVLGAAPWERVASTVLDAMIDQTPMIFSYCHAEAQHWYPFRIAYSLNLSVRKEDFLECGGFPELIRPYYYEDLAFGCRVLGPHREGLFYQPRARVLHRHPMTFDQYLDREELLGVMAPVLARHCPEAFAVVMAGRSVEQIAADFQRKLQGDGSVYRRLYRRLQQELSVPATGVSAASPAVQRRFQLHIPVKLLAFRLGFLKGLELVDDHAWQERRSAGLWRRFIEADNAQSVAR